MDDSAKKDLEGKMPTVTSSRDTWGVWKGLVRLD